jgi:hypothetical protein
MCLRWLLGALPACVVWCVQARRCLAPDSSRNPPGRFLGGCLLGVVSTPSCHHFARTPCNKDKKAFSLPTDPVEPGNRYLTFGRWAARPFCSTPSGLPCGPLVMLQCKDTPGWLLGRGVQGRKPCCPWRVSLAGGSLACRHGGRLGFVNVRGAGVQQQLWSFAAAAAASVFSSSL